MMAGRRAARCWLCDDDSVDVYQLGCGHMLCMVCMLEKIHVKNHTEECKQPCPACLHITVPKAQNLSKLPVVFYAPEGMFMIAGCGCCHNIS